MKGSFIYYPNLKLGEGACSKWFYGLNRTNGDEIAIKFTLNKKAIIDYNMEGIIINKLCDF